MKIYINGKLYAKDQAKVSVFDHGLLYGDGVFEGIRAYDGRIFKLAEHVERLYESAKTIMLKIPMTQKAMIKAIIKTIRANKLKSGYVRVVVTRGVGTLGLNPFTCKKPQIIIIADKIKLYPEDYYKKGLSLITAATVRNRSESINPRVKSLNYLNNIMAKIEAINAGVIEAIMFDSSGYVAECTGDNIFIIKKGVLFTPPIHMGILQGITRDAVIGLAYERGISVNETTITRHDIFNADECFLTGTAAEVIPVVKVDGRKIGSGKVGKMTKKLISDFRELTKIDGELI